MTSKAFTTAAVLAAALLGVAGCGDDTGPAPAGTAGTSGATSAPAPAGSSGTAPAVPSGTASGSASGTAGVEPVAASASASPSATSTLGLVDGFPVDLVPVLPGATVTASTVGGQGDRLEVSLSGTTTKTRKAVLAYYAKVFEKAGYTRPEGDRIGPGTVTRVWARGDAVVVVAVDDGDPRSFSVGGTVIR